jgi:hemolysin III
VIKDPFSGLSHLVGGLVAIFGMGWLVARSGPTTGAMVTAWVYGACLVALYLASSAYHLVVASERATRVLRLIDHAAIFAMVAGTCTPVFYRALSGRTLAIVLGAMWGAAAVGIVFKLAWRGAPRALYTAIYVAMGWSSVLFAPALVSNLPRAALALVVAGGVTYTCGALVYAVKRPNPFPRVFGFHEIWHLFVLGGSALHYAAVALIVTPA